MNKTIQELEKAISDIHLKKIELTETSDLREYIKDSIDLGEVLAILDTEIDLGKFVEVVTVKDFLEMINSNDE
jgi:hypothetical protein